MEIAQVASCKIDKHNLVQKGTCYLYTQQYGLI